MDGMKAKIIQTLLLAEADPQVQDKTKATPLHNAAKCGNTPAAKQILSHIDPKPVSNLKTHPRMQYKVIDFYLMYPHLHTQLRII